MDLGPPSVPVCVMMVCLLGAARFCSGVESNCQCPAIPQHSLTEPPGSTCLNINKTYRYKCVTGYVRKVGTSNLIRCQQKDDGLVKWTTANLQCIPDPKRTTTKPPITTVTMGNNDIPHDSTITTTVTVGTTTLQTTPIISTSASVTAETHSAAPTSTTAHSQGAVNETKATDGTTATSTTTKPLNSTINPQTSNLEPSSLAALIACVSLVIIIALIGTFYYKWRSKNNNRRYSVEEQTPMNPFPFAPAS